MLSQTVSPPPLLRAKIRPCDDDAIQRLRANAEDLKSLGVRSLFLFGSTARDEARPESDVDVFVEYDLDRFGLIELVGLKRRVSEMLGRPVDVTTRDALHPLFRERIETEAFGCSRWPSHFSPACTTS